MWNPPSLFARVVLIGAAALGLLAGTVILVPYLGGLGERDDHPPATRMASPGPPIPAEARPYRPAIIPSGTAGPDRRPGTHPRTLEYTRRVRAYPGAPPRIPHGLTEEEYRLGTCNVCHARGGFAPRFGAYAPVTPHPELSDCLQCHAPDARTVGIDPAPPSPDALCLQCHVDPDAPPPRFVALDWTTTSWPEIGGTAMAGSPPWIPHDLRFRENCLACHGGPGAVREIRTTHPERIDCRSCHVPAHGEPGSPFPPPTMRGSDPGDAR